MTRHHWHHWRNSVSVAQPKSLKAKEFVQSITLEDPFLRSIIDAAERYKWLWFHDEDSRRNQAGLPDLILCSYGRLIMAELKRQKGRLRPAQKRWHDALCRVERVEVPIWRPSDYDHILEILKPNYRKGGV